MSQQSQFKMFQHRFGSGGLGAALVDSTQLNLETMASIRLAGIEQEPPDCFHIFIINEPTPVQKGGEQP
jgi:hypothetical protein